jgi:DNA-binding NarL/FixJ family response regulator
MAPRRYLGVSSRCVQAPQQDTAGLDAASPGAVAVAVVGALGCDGELARSLAGEGLEPTLFEDVDGLLGLESEPPSQIVLRVEAGSPFPAQIERLLQAFGESQVVLVCAEEVRGWEVRAALEAGAAGVVLESELERALGPCLAVARAGQVCVPRRHRQRIDPPSLSSREKQILGLVVMGQTNGQIAERLVLAESTVKSHLSSAFGKLGVRSRNEAVDLILDSERGLGILGLGGEPLQSPLTPAP